MIAGPEHGCEMREQLVIYIFPPVPFRTRNTRGRSNSRLGGSFCRHTSWCRRRLSWTPMNVARPVQLRLLWYFTVYAHMTNPMRWKRGMTEVHGNCAPLRTNIRKLCRQNVCEYPQQQTALESCISDFVRMGQPLVTFLNTERLCIATACSLVDLRVASG